MNLQKINSRVDLALHQNRRAEYIVIVMAAAIFVLGIAVATVGAWAENAYLTIPAVVLEGLLYWPIKSILKLRRDNITLQTVPAIVTVLPRQQ